MTGTTSVDKTEKVGITLPKSILQKIGKVRGDIPRSIFVRRAVETYLKQRKAR
jgi:metal-responsive CopG/Arc/MetJ family transcriptional regulator